jgi:formylglycine-generating enzyme required for sulfatase activity
VSSPLLDLDAWNRASPRDQDRVIEAIAGFEVCRTHAYGPGAPRIHTLRQRSTGLLFNAIPGGRYVMGLSAEEVRALRPRATELDDAHAVIDDYHEVEFAPMRPPHEVRVRPFLLARFPLTRGEAARLVELEEDDERAPLWGPASETAAIYLSRNERDALLERTSLRLPSESEWEWACRAGTRSLFYWGDHPPATEAQERAALLRDFADPATCDARSNRFGVCGLQVGEYCSDTWHDSYAGAPSDGTPWIDGSSVDQVIRGIGPIMDAPDTWQGCAWPTFISAARGSTASDPWQSGAGVRPALSLDVT